METGHFFHMFANGDDAKNFITSEQDNKAAFNRFAVCAYLTGVVVVSFSVEDSHPHALLWGTEKKCTEFKELYGERSVRYIARVRGSADGVRLNLELDPVMDESYLLNVAAYTIVQPTKDGKAIMPYDYRYGTGALYFRSKYCILPWLVNDDGSIARPVPLGSLTLKERNSICGTKILLPDTWLTCNGFILPTNYVDVRRFENVYRTHNCFRVFMCSSKNRDEEILKRMSDVRGVIVEDLEARRLCADMCWKLFARRTTHHLSVQDRITLAQHLRKAYGFSFRQIATLIHIPEEEIRKYLR